MSLQMHNMTMGLRIGIGYDAHRLVKGRPLILGGVQIEHGYGLDGHSDADVLTHTIMDALLGALALGSIGDHFPDTDPSFKGADSIELLKQVVSLIAEKGYQIVNIDSVIVAQQPKLSPHTSKMQACLAEATRINKQDIGIKPTTTEKMGPEGRKEGISAHAVVLLQKA